MLGLNSRQGGATFYPRAYIYCFCQIFHEPLSLFWTLEYLWLLNWELGSLVHTPSTVHMLLPRIQFPHDGNLYPAWLLLAWKLLSFYHVEIAFQDASPGLGLQHAWCLLHHGEFLIMQFYYKIICQMTVHILYLNLIAYELKYFTTENVGGKSLNMLLQ